MNLKELSAKIRGNVGLEVQKLQAEGIFPRLQVILVGGDESAVMYAASKKKIGEGLGIEVIVDVFPETVSQSDLERHISKVSLDDRVHGVLLESPFPAGLDYNAALRCVPSTKDVDGLHEVNQGRLLGGNFTEGIIPATPLGIVTILEELVGEISGREIVLVGGGRTVGRPLAALLIQKGAIITVTNSFTKNLPEICQRTNIIITATGKRGLITTEMVHKDSIVIDAGISVNPEGKTVGDTDYASVAAIARFVTPVPGGVGMITTGVVFQNLIRAISLQKNLNHLDVSVSQFLTLASGPNMPGGGGVAAIVGALGVSMVSMVASLTKEESLDSRIRAELEEKIESVKQFYQADIGAFNGYLSAIRLPKEKEEEKSQRATAIQTALKNACEIPLEFAESILELTGIILEVARLGNKNVISDVAVGMRLIISSVHASFEGIHLNIKSLKDKKFISEVLEREKQILEKLHELEESCLSLVSER